MYPARKAVERAVSMDGVAFKDKGRGPHGVDCLGLMLYAYGLKDEDFPETVEAMSMIGGYYQSRVWKFDKSDAAIRAAQLLQDSLSKRLLPVTLKAVKPGDIFLMAFKSRKSGLGDHLSMYVGNKKIIHASKGGVAILDINQKIIDAILGAYRMKEAL